MKTLRRAGQVIVIVAAGAVASMLAGCADNASVGTTAPAAPLSEVVKGGQNVQATSGDEVQLVTYDPNYQAPSSQSNSAGVIKTSGGKLSAGGFALNIPSGALAAPTFISLEAISGPVMQCRVEPTGLVFQKPVTLVFKYSGTSADRNSTNYDSSGSLTGAWLDPSNSQWVRIGGWETGKNQFCVELSHLSYYALAK